MDIDSSIVIYIFGMVALIFGVHVIVTGKVVFYPGEDDRLAEALNGTKARFVGTVILIASAFLLLGIAFGYLILAVAIVLPILISQINN